MPNCQTIDPLITPFVDGELPVADRRGVEAHLRACPPCHSRVAAERAVHALMQQRRAALHASCAPSEPLRAACALIARLTPRVVEDRADAGRSPGAWTARVVPYALAASLVIGV